ncbi:MAG: hypothetical protein CMO55_08935 [Verrucomicrobiales bacterium]|nr:hypothetical protein [Verrucomicrobiales bacterium]
MNVRKCLILSLLVGGVFALNSCETGGNKETGPEPAPVAANGPINADGFLKNDHEPLNKWLDERFEVDYKHMTPALIFDQVPLNDIFYETSNLPQDATPLNFSSSDVSRRELLKKIASHWRLKMSLVTDAAGNPTAVRVEG